MIPSKDAPVVSSRRLPSSGQLIRATSVSALCLAPVFVEHRTYYWCRYLLLRRFLCPVAWPRHVTTLGPDFYVGSSMMCSRDSALGAWSLVASHFERCLALAEEYLFVVRDAMMISLSRGFAVSARWPFFRRALTFEVYLRMDHGRSYDKQGAVRCVEAYKTLVTEVLLTLAE